MKHPFAALLLAAATSVLALVGCADDESNPTPAADALVLHVGYENAVGEPFDQGCRKWQELVNQRSHGKMQLKLYPLSTLGSKSEGIVFGPFLFNNWEEANRLHHSAWYKDQAQKLEKQAHLKIVAANWRYGARHTLSTQPITQLEDFQGLRVRVPTNIIQIKGFEVLGAKPVPMPLDEVYNALKKGEIDAVENPLAVLYNGKFQEVAKYLLLDGHVHNVTNLVVGEAFWNSVTITFPDELLRIQLKAASLKFYTLPEFSKWSPNLYETVNKAMHGE